MRSCRVLPSSRRAVAVMALSGPRTRPATSQPSPIEATDMRARAMPDWVRSCWRVAAWSSRRTASASRRTAATASGEGAAATNWSPPSAAPARMSTSPWASPSASDGPAARLSILTPKGRVSWERTSA